MTELIDQALHQFEANIRTETVRALEVVAAMATNLSITEIGCFDPMTKTKGH